MPDSTDTRPRVVVPRDQWDRLNDCIRASLPALRDRLRARHGATLDEWLRDGPYLGITCEIDDGAVDSLATDLETLVELWMSLNVDGWEGWIPAASDWGIDFKAKARAVVDSLAAPDSATSGFRGLLAALASNSVEKQYREHALFLVYQCAVASGLSQPCASLWLLESDLDEFAYLFTIENGSTLKDFAEDADLLPEPLSGALRSGATIWYEGDDDD